MLWAALGTALGLAVLVIGIMGGLTGPNGRWWAEPCMRAGVVLTVVSFAMLIILVLYHFLAR